MSNDFSHFLDLLPPELRIEIYGIAALDVEVVCVPPKPSKRVVTQHPLQAVCREILVEFGGWLTHNLPAGNTGAKTIVARVVNFDFDPLMTYLRKIPKHKVPVEFDFGAYSRGLRGDLVITDEWCKDADIHSCLKWLKFLKSKVKAGAPFGPEDIWYTVVELPKEGGREILPFDLFTSEVSEWLLPMLRQQKIIMEREGDVAMEAEARAKNAEAVKAEGIYFPEVSEEDALDVRQFMIDCEMWEHMEFMDDSVL